MTETKNPNQWAIDLAGLIEDGHLDLDRLLDGATWTWSEAIATYTACVYGPDGDEPGEVEVGIETAEAYGITAYRTVERDAGDLHEIGRRYVDRDAAVAACEEIAEESDELPDADDLIEQIVATGYFGAADEDDIRAVCEEATEYSQGYLLLRAGEPTYPPVGRMWTTSGYLEGEHVRLAADYESIAYAAHALLAAVRGPASGGDDD